MHSLCHKERPDAIIDHISSGRGVEDYSPAVAEVLDGTVGGGWFPGGGILGEGDERGTFAGGEDVGESECEEGGVAGC